MYTDIASLTEIPDSLICRLSHPALYRRNETFGNPAWDDASLRILIVRLSPYEDVAKSYSHLFLAQEARRGDAGAYVDFSFLPNRNDRRLLAAAGVAPCFGVQSHRPAACYDVLLVSCAYVLELVNFPWLLLESSIPLYASERASPLVILGGSAALASGGLTGPAGDTIPDAIFFGEGERHVGEIIRRIAEAPTRERASCLAALTGKIDGLWAGPDRGRSVTVARCGDVQAHELTSSYPVLPGGESGTGRLQISYGCPFTCAFCFEGQTRRPYREVPLHTLLRTARAIKRNTGASRIELSSYNFNSHDQIGPLFLELNGLFREVSAMSQRPDLLYGRPGLLELELAGEKRTFTIGIEGLSERQRKYLGKEVRFEDVKGLIVRLIGHRIPEMKLFYILSGHETEDDFAEFGRFCRWLRQELDRSGARTRVVFSANRLVRMPFTPLQFDPVILDKGHWDGLLRRLEAVVNDHGMEIRALEPWVDYVAEQLLVCGQDWVHEGLIRLARAGLVYDGGMPGEAMRVLLENLNRDVPESTGDTEHDRSAGPLTVVPVGYVRLVSPEDSLSRRFERLREGLLDLPEAHLHGAGMQQDTGASPRGRTAVSGELICRLEQSVKDRKRLQPEYALVRLPREVSGMGSEWLGAWLARNLIADVPELEECLVFGSEMLWYPAWGEKIPWHGLSVISIIARHGLPGSAFNASEWMVKSLDPVDAGKLQSAGVVLRLPLSATADPEGGFSRFLVSSHSPATIRHASDGWYSFDITDRTRKAKVVLSGRFRRGEHDFEAELSVGRRFNPESFFHHITSPERYEEAIYRASIEVTGIDPWSIEIALPGSA